MSEDIKKLGQIFKARRGEMKLSIKEIENATSIRSNYLEAIEEGRVDQFLSSVYTFGFIHQYANYLGLDIEKMKKEFPAAFKPKAEKHEFDYGIGTLEMRGAVGGGVRWLPNLIWGGVSIAVLVIAWYAAKYLGVL